MSSVQVEYAEDGRATIRLARPERHNAFDDVVIAELTEAFSRASSAANVRWIVLESTGPSFSAGADLAWMRRMADYSEADNQRDAYALANLMRIIDTCPRPVVAVVQGAAYGGGVGLIAACDIAVAAETATFSLSEVRLGLIPAAISPYVAAAIGARACRRYFLTAERFSAAEAHRLGLVHEVAPADGLLEARDRLLAALSDGGPQAQAAAKELVAGVIHRAPDESLARWTAARIAEIRASDEGREGVSAFLERRKPAWKASRP
ncbi:MAG TPA: enoyl-CoA hydratase/isomerase family protein [Steroidobacter sp.]|jgi:methylglutaconyl-CoA hydratase|nr:enoyl-CoA hydratase/isomerase family protein [Steroidobacteraceae bacterium]HLS81213.1 enoyl-CoA hydratase/isomerase family protein [Steroidobacter sp.]